MTRYATLVLAFAAAAFGSPVGAQRDADRAVIHEFLERYTDLKDAGDMRTQAQMMTEDRVYIGVFNIGRRLSQPQNTRIQQAAMDLNEDLYPGLQVITDVKDPYVHFVTDDVAVASFRWVRNFIPTAELVRSGVDLPDSPSSPVWFSQVLVKDGGEWKIAHTHVSLAQPSGN